MNFRQLVLTVFSGAALGSGPAQPAPTLESELELLGSREPTTEIERIPLDSETGQSLLADAYSVDYEAMEGHWIPQLPSHCGAASAVIVKNSMIEEAAYTQNNLFTEDTAHIITQDVVSRIGFTLEELTTMIAARSGLRTERFHAGRSSELHGLDAFREALRETMNNPDRRLIVNFSRQYWLGTGTLGGHFSPIAAWNEEENKVLVLEVNQNWPMVWVDVEDMWESMYTIDSVSGLTRGWVVVESATNYE